MSLRDWPIRQKLTAMLVLSSGLVLVLTSAALVGYQYWSFRQTMRSTLSVRGSILATNSTAVLSLSSATDTKDDAEEILKARERLNRTISDATGQPLAKVRKDTDRNFWMSPTEARDYGIVGAIVSTVAELPR